MLGWIKQRPVAALGAAAAVGLAILLAYLLLTGGSDPRVEAARRQGYPMSAAELDAKYPPNSAALAMGSALLQALGHPAAPNPNLLSLATNGVKAAEWEELRLFYATNGAWLDRLCALPRNVPCRYTSNVQQATNLPFGELRKGVFFLVSHALLKSHDHQPDQAVRSLVAAGTIADSLKAEPALMAQMVRDAVWSATCTGIARSANLTSFDEAQITELERLLDAAEPRGLALGLIADRAMAVSMLHDPSAQARTLTSGLSKVDRFNTMTALTALRATGTLSGDRAYYLDTMARLIDVAGKQPPERVRLERQQGTNPAPRKLYVFSRILLPALTGAVSRAEVATARVHLARTILALERFQIRNGGELPATLNELVPAYIASVPMDPFDGQPIRYRRDGHGYVVYSIGPNGTDDGSLEAGPGKGTGTGDIVYRVRVEK